MGDPQTASRHRHTRGEEIIVFVLDRNRVGFDPLPTLELLRSRRGLITEESWTGRWRGNVPEPSGEGLTAHRRKSLRL